MNDSLVVVIGMSIMYVFSLAGLILAWVSYRKRRGSE
jgi:hypothetical protein